MSDRPEEETVAGTGALGKRNNKAAKTITFDLRQENTNLGSSAAVSEPRDDVETTEDETRNADSATANKVFLTSSIYAVSDEDDDRASTDSIEGYGGQETTITKLSQTCWRKTRLCTRKLISSPVYTAIFLFFILFSVFGVDIFISAFAGTRDRALEVLSSICFFVFLLDVVLTVWTKSYILESDENTGALSCLQAKGYAFSFFFWLDLITGLSMIFDMPWLWNPLTGSADSIYQEDIATARAGRFARIGTRVGRLLRIIQVLKLGKSYELPAHASGSIAAVEEKKRRQIGNRLTDITIRRVIILILVTLLSLFLLFPPETDNSERNSVKLLHSFNLQRPPGWQTVVSSLKTEFRGWEWAGGATRFQEERLVFLRIEPANDSIKVDIPDVYQNIGNNFFVQELAKHRFEDPGILNSSETDFITEAWFNHRPIAIERSLFNIGLAIFILFIIILGSVVFSLDAYKLVSSPIENMVDMAYQAIQDPTKQPPELPRSHMYETKVLQNTVKKIGCLLRLGFGGQGARVVQRHLVEFGQNNSELGRSAVEAQDSMRRERVMEILSRSFKHAPSKPKEGSSDFLRFGHFNPNVHSRRVETVFVRFRITNINQIYAALGERAPVLLNHVSALVHDRVISWGGSVARNLHDGWQCVWLVPPEMSNGVYPLFENESSSSAGKTNLETLFSSQGRRKKDTENVSLSREDPLFAASMLHYANEDLPPARGMCPKFLEKFRGMFGGVNSTENSNSVGDNEERYFYENPSDVADQPLFAALRICASINRSKELHDSPEAQKLKKWVKDNFLAEISETIKIQCSLHGGWANELAVGSSRKVDVLYYSPHFFAAEYLSKIGGEYGSCVIMSEAFHSALSKEAKCCCRMVDCRELPLKDQLKQDTGEKIVSHLFVYDTWSWMERAHRISKQLINFGKFLRFHVDPDALNKRSSHTHSGWNRISVLGAADVIAHPVDAEKYSAKLFIVDSDLIALRAPWEREDLIELHKKAVRQYLRGDWQKAKELLEQETSLGPLPSVNGDMAGNAILDFIRKFDYQAPNWWQGYRWLEAA